MNLSNLSENLLSESIGIFAGDGSLYSNGSTYVFEIRGNKNEIEYYKNTVKPIFERIFSKELRIIKRTYTGGYVIGIRVCGKKPYEIFHEELGFPVGSKSNILKIPEKIFQNKSCWIHYIRGIFDTDGSIYYRKSGKNMKYKQPVVDITSKSIIHLNQIRHILKNLGFNCWIEKKNYKVRMAGWSTINRFFNLIKPKNNKHLEKYIRWGGRVA